MHSKSFKGYRNIFELWGMGPDMNNKYANKDENNDYILEASRCTLAIVLATSLIWGIFDIFNAQNTGFGFP
ncbi:hypothetical protein [Lysinibacillus zambalensis]